MSLPYTTIAKKRHSPGASALGSQLRPAKTGLNNPAHFLVGELFPRRADFFSVLNGKADSSSLPHLGGQ
jgi:hypothetical protein